MMKRKWMKTLLATTLAASMIVGCGATVTEVAEEQEAPVETEVESTLETESTQTEVDTIQEEEEMELDRTIANAMIKDMNAGWNLGNTLEAHGAGNTLATETCWLNPKTTKEMIDTVVNKGFNTIRIPVTWAEHMGQAPDYQVNEEWMARVREVVDYAYEDGAYVILNSHHDTDFWLTPNPDTAEQVVDEFRKLWKQIAEEFKDYGDHLVFEGMNEVRTKGSKEEWSGGTPEERVVINQLNKAFVETVRSTGGNNETRCLILSTYGHSPSYKALHELALPQDGNIAVAVHMYTPYYFTYKADQVNQYSNWDGSRKDEIIMTVKELKKCFIDNGIPVIVTETGAEDKDNSDDIVRWIDDYMDAMNKYSIPCIWWDNGSKKVTNEKFGIFDRVNLSWEDEKVVDEFIKKANE